MPAVPVLQIFIYGTLVRVSAIGRCSLKQWRQQGLNPPPQVLQSTSSYGEDNDTVGQWIEGACIVEAEVRATMKELYDSYKSWCEHSAADALSNNCFGKELTRAVASRRSEHG